MDIAQGAVGFLGCKYTLLRYVELLAKQHPQVLLPQAALSPFSCPACSCAQDCPDPGPYTWPYWTWGHKPTSQTCQSFWMASLPCGVLTTPHGLVSLANVLRVLPLITSPIKTLNSASSNSDPWEGSHQSSFGHQAVDPNSLSANIQPILYTSIKSMSLRLRDKDAMWDSIKHFAQVQADDIGQSSLIPPSTVTPPRKAPRFVGLSEAMLAASNHLLISRVHHFQEDLLHDLALHWSETDWPAPALVLVIRWMLSSGCPTVTSSSGVNSSTIELFLNLAEVKKRL